MKTEKEIRDEIDQLKKCEDSAIDRCRFEVADKFREKIATLMWVLNEGGKMKSIIFSSEMVRAILDGRKSQTRRIIKPQPSLHHWELLPSYKRNIKIMKTSTGLCLRTSHSIDENTNEDGVQWINPEYQPGDRVYVKETWALPEPMDEDTLVYKASCNELDLKLMYWKSPLFMPEKYARIFLEITGVRVERVREITEVGARAEGATCAESIASDRYWPTYRDSFADLWNSIYKSKPEFQWKANPWVWVYEFGRGK